MTMDIEGFSTAARLIAIGSLMLLIVVHLAARISMPMKISVIGLLSGSIGYLINSSYVLAPADFVYRPFIDIISISTSFWAWFFAQILFEHPVKRKFIIALAGGLILFWMINFFWPDSQPLSFIGIHLLSLLAVIHIIYIAVADKADDLIEKRRQIRTYLPLIIILQVGGVLIAELIWGVSGISPLLTMLNVIGIIILSGLAGLALLTVDPSLLTKTQAPAAPSDPRHKLSPAETVLYEKLQDAMQDGYYRSAGLSIQQLADHLETPPHRLRNLINRGLGYRNFSSFLNDHRIAEAKEKLADKSFVNLPILTIAMDLGYGSLAPFNRAFRSKTGITPSDFRKQAINQN